MKIHQFTLAVLFLLLTKSVAAQPQSHLQEFTDLLPGFYSTNDMWKKDTTLFHVELHIVPMWKDSTTGFWFYLEQAEVNNLTKPYRQAILHVTSDGKKIVSRNIPLRDRMRFAGAWNTEALLKNITASDLDYGGACELYFIKDSFRKFSGGTGSTGCNNQYKGATYFTNISTLTDQALTSWDRGWKADGQLVWGPDKQGYTFDRVSK